jgi:hypothetical protein
MERDRALNLENAARFVRGERLAGLADKTAERRDLG